MMGSLWECVSQRYIWYKKTWWNPTQVEPALWMRSFTIFEQIWTHGIHGILCNINFPPFNIPPPNVSLSSYASKYLLCLSSPADYSTSSPQPGRWFLSRTRNERPKPHLLSPSDSALLSTLPGILLKRASSAGKEFGRGNISEQFSSLIFFLP